MIDMPKLDFFEKEYSLKEIIDAYIDGSIDNFKGDTDFLDFYISYAIGKFLEGPDAEKYKKYASSSGIMIGMWLDDLGYLGAPLYKIYEICDKNKDTFIRSLSILRNLCLKSLVTKEIIDINLKLKKPVSFIDDSITLDNGKKPEWRKLGFSEKHEYEEKVAQSLKRRINESIRENNEEIKPLQETNLEDENQKVIPDDYIVNINNLYYGSEIYDVSGGVIGLNMKMVSWFEYTNMDFLSFHFFRSIPSGDYCLVDNNGNIHIPETIINLNDITIGPNTPIRSVNIANVPTILSSAIKKLEEDPIVNETSILNLKSLLEQLEMKGTLSVAETKQYDTIIRTAYEIAYGKIFPARPNEDRPIDGNLSL